MIKVLERPSITLKELVIDYEDTIENYPADEYANDIGRYPYLQIGQLVIQTTDTTKIVQTDINRDLYLVSLRYRFTKTIFIRGSINYNKSNSSYFSQDYMVNWNPSKKLSISSQMRIQDDNEIKITKRYNTQLNYKIGRNANVYISYLITDLTKAKGDRNKSIRAGFRSGL